MKLSFLQVVRLLRRAQDWEKDTNSMWNDSVRHKTAAVQFYSEQAIIFKDKAGGEIVYKTNPLTWAFILIFLAPRIRRAVFGGERP